jgi:O-antigen/teichoic acid export membrane protein
MASPNQFRHRIASGLVWESSTKLGMQVLSWVSMIWVARILTPDDYGIVAISGIYTLLIQIFADYGLTSGLVTRATVGPAQFRSAFWFNLYAACVLYAVLYATAPWIAGLYGLPALTDVLRVAGLGVFVNAARVVPMSLVLRAMDYRFRALAEMIGQAVQAISLLVLAMNDFREWSLVWSFLIGQGVTTCFFLARLRGVGRPTVDLAPIRDILGFGARMTVHRLVGFALGMSDMFVVSVMVGQRASGLFLMAQNLANMPLDKLGSIVNRISFPAVARLQDEMERVRSYFLNAHFWIVAICTPIAIGGALIAPDLVTLLFTQKWSESGTILALLCAASAFRVSGMMMPAVLEGLRHAGFLMRYTIASAALILPAYVAGAWLGGVVGVAAAAALTAPVLWAVLVHFTLSKIGLRFGTFVESIRPVVIALAVMALSVVLARRTVAEHGLVARLVVEVGTGAVTYAAVLWLLVPKQRVAMLSSLLGQLRSPGPAKPETTPAG